MHRFRQLHGVEKCPEGADDFQPPPGPIMGFSADFRSQLFDGGEGLHLGTLEVFDLYTCVIDNLVMIAHEMEEATHVRPSTRSKGWKVLAGFAGEVKRPCRPSPYSPFVAASPSMGWRLPNDTQPISGRGTGTR